MPDRRIDIEARDRITELERAVDARMDAEHRRIVRFGLGLLVMNLLAILACAVGLFMLSNLIQEVQANRREVVRTSCTETNARHDATIRELNRRLDALKDGAPRAQRTQIETSRRFSIALINALQPKRSCQELVDRLG